MTAPGARMEKTPPPVVKAPPPRRGRMESYQGLVRWCEENHIRDIAKRISGRCSE